MKHINQPPIIFYSEDEDTSQKYGLFDWFITCISFFLVKYLTCTMAHLVSFMCFSYYVDMDFNLISEPTTD